MSETLEKEFHSFFLNYLSNSEVSLSQTEDIVDLLKKMDYSKDFKSLVENQSKVIENQKKVIENQSKVIDNLSKSKNIDYKEIDKILANNVKDLKTNSKELVRVNNKLYDKSDSGFHSFYYLGSVIIGFFIGYVVINTFLQLAFDN